MLETDHLGFKLYHGTHLEKALVPLYHKSKTPASPHPDTRCGRLAGGLRDRGLGNDTPRRA